MRHAAHFCLTMRYMRVSAACLSHAELAESALTGDVDDIV